MFVFPTLLGAFLDFALINYGAFECSFPALQAPFAVNHPVLFILVLWMLGISHVLVVTVNIILLRDILHPQVVDRVLRLRDPNGYVLSGG